MKKNILTILLFSLALSPLALVPINDERSGHAALCRDEQKIEEEEFDDFFGEPDVASVRPQKKKKKWSRLKVFMVQLGVAVALRTQTLMQWLGSIWAYLVSWVIREKDVAPKA